MVSCESFYHHSCKFCFSAEEQSVVDSFQGEQAYAEVMRRADYYLASPVKADTLMLPFGTEEKEEGAA